MDTKDITKEEQKHNLKMNLLLKHLGDKFYKNGERHNSIADAMEEYHQSQSTQIRDRIEELEGVLQRIYDIRDLWKYPENLKTEHEEEAIALHSMELKIKTALNNK